MARKREAHIEVAPDLDPRDPGGWTRENVRFTRTTYRVVDFLSWQRSKTLVLSPSFQRRNVWRPEAKSYLIDTVVRGLPVPVIFLRERTSLRDLQPKREVVDGQQRLRTLIAFIDPGALPDFQKGRDDFVVLPIHNEELAGKVFPQLAEPTQRRVLDYEFSVQVLASDTDDREVLQIFARLNSTGVTLNGQELRNAEYFGYVKQTAYELAYEQLTRWREWGIFSELEIARMAEVELVSDLFVLILHGIQAKTQKVINALYKEKDANFSEREEVAYRFRAVMDGIDDTVGTQLPRLVYSGQTLFHTLFTYLYDLLFTAGSGLEHEPARKLPRGLGTNLTKASHVIASGEVSEELARALRGRTTHAASRRARLEFLRQACGSAQA